MDVNVLAAGEPWQWPPNAGATFRKLLTNHAANPADRLTAASLAGEEVVMDDDLANVLLGVLSDRTEPEDLRAQAAISLGPVLELGFWEFEEELDDFGDPEMVPIGYDVFCAIKQALKREFYDLTNPKLLRRRILEAAVRAPEPWQSDAIREAYASGDHEWKLTAVFGMRHVKGFEREVLEALETKDREILFEAVEAAGEKGLELAWHRIFGLANDKRTEKSLRVAAIGAIGSIRPQEAQELLYELKDSKDELIAAAAEEALSYIDIGAGDEEDGEDEDDEDEEENDESPF
jgi:hypothetical protein